MWFEGLAAFAAALIFGWGFRRRSLYQKALGYDPRKAHRYEIDGAFVPLDQAGPSASPPSRLLRIEVRADFLGALFDPEVLVTTGDRSVTFCLERGARGTRYLCLPPLGGGKLEFRTRRVNLVGSPDVWLSGVPPLRDGPLLVVAPHPDDAEIAAYGLFRECADRAHIVTVTLGELGKAPRAPVVKAEGWTAWLRRYDSLTVPQLAGVPESRITNLEFSEADLQSARSGEAERRLEERLAESIASIAPTIVVVPHPTLDTHPVHQAVTRATVAALGRTGSSATLFFCLIHVPRGRSYPLGSAEMGIALPPHFDGGRPFSELVCLPLSEETRSEKIFALDAHHDLRNAPKPFAKEPSLWTQLRGRLRERLYGVGRVASFDYFRRAARPYEVFLVSSLDEALRMLGDGRNEAAEPSRT